MATTAQINANRKNSKKSTGPKTIEGKKAVSKNALKHGLFTNEAVIAGESLEDYNTLREKTLDELCPIGNMETILAERIVSLTWRLKRIERFQSIVIDAMIDKKLNSPVANLAKKMIPSQLRTEQQEEQENIDSTLGKVIISDYSSSRVLDRLSIYERRIENSLFKTINELRRTQILREMEREKKETEEIIAAEAEEPGFVKNNYAEAGEMNSASHKATQNQESSFLQQDEGDTPRCGRHKQPSHGAGNNEKQSQFADLRLESRSTKSEIRNNIKCSENQILETNVQC